MKKQAGHKTMMHRPIKLFLVLTLLAALLVGAVSAAPPFQTSEGVANELSIIYPKESVFNIGDDIKLHFHVYNSTGYALNASDVNCRIHIYGHDGNHLIDSELLDGEETSVTVDKEIYLTSANLSGVGDYGYAVYCNSTQGEAGFLSGSFAASRTGTAASIDDLPIIIGLFMIAISLLIISSLLNNKHFLFKLLSQVFSLYFLYLIPSITLNNYSEIGITFFKLFNNFIKIFWLYVFIYAIYELLDYFGKLAKIKRGLNNITHKYKKK